MREQEVMLYGGDVLKEMDEARKLMADEEQTVVYGTQTMACQIWLTIHCC